ncbi:unnamed protein product [Owenia fusiformis]|uniref:Uncharacterized protein n=1 Tax=Owenia fusiformis TaxID=6347 RepID=A0A8J1TIH8_OWEFU|nr:unnamed protein product [Owenia fusiformis]
MANEELVQFTWADWLVFGLALLASILIGFYYGCTGNKQSTTEEVLLGDRKMSMVPVSISILATFVSTIGVIGFPSDIYDHGTMILYILIGCPIGYLITAHVYLPIYHDLKLTSVYEYLELRFNKSIRIIAVILYSFQILVYISISLYASSITLTQVSEIPLWGTIVLNGVVCMLYTTVGGIKGVLWADTLQIGLVLSGCLAIIIKGSISVGGLDKAFEISAIHGRIEFDELNPDPRTRHSLWGMSFGFGLLYIGTFSSSQHYVQRYLTLDTKRKAQIVLYVNMALFVVCIGIICIIGVVMFATYATCDPKKLGLVKQSDQMLGYFVMDLFGSMKGMPGLFIVTVTAAAMSTMSSGQNALAAVYLEDVSKPIYKAVHKKSMTERFATNITKCFGAFFGIATIAVTFILAEAKDTIIVIYYKLSGILGGPIFGMFTIGILFPCANTWGVASGLFSSLGILIWINTGVLMFKIGPKNLPTDISGCTNTTKYSNTTTTTTTSEYAKIASLGNNGTTPAYLFNTSHLDVTNVTSELGWKDESGIFYLYNVSYVWYTLIALIVTFAVGLPVSLVASSITGKYKREDVDKRLYWPVYETIRRCLPECCQRKKSVGKVESVSTTVIIGYNGSHRNNGSCPEAQCTDGTNNTGITDFTQL